MAVMRNIERFLARQPVPVIRCAGNNLPEPAHPRNLEVLLC
jgi:hypothetical protein